MAREARGLCQVAQEKPISKISVAGKAVGIAGLKKIDEKDQTPETEASVWAAWADHFVPVW